MFPRILGFAVVFGWSAVVAFAADPNLEGAKIPAGFSAPRLVRDINPVAGNRGSEAHGFVKVGERSVFLAADERGTELHATDGTAAGTVRLVDLCLGPCGSELIRFAETPGLYFFTRYPRPESQPGRRELWATDGTMPGTRRVALGIDSAEANRDDRLWVESAGTGGRFYFAWDDGASGPELWASDGRPEGTRSLLPFDEATAPGLSIGNAGLPVLRGRLLFVARRGGAGPSIWSTDGTLAGTFRLRRFDAITGLALYSALPFSDRLYFSGITGSIGAEPWSTDGTPEGTRLLADLCSGACGSRPGFWRAIGGRMFLEATSRDGGRGVWSTDGTAEGTTAATQACLGGCHRYFWPIGAAGSRLIFALDVPGRGGFFRLYGTDGTEEGTEPLGDGETLQVWGEILSGVSIGSQFVFSAYDSAHGVEVWTTDGTDVGTHLLSDVGDGDAGGSLPGPPVALGEQAIFIADGGHGEQELWASDGTRQGTLRLAGLGEPVDPQRIYVPSISGHALAGSRLLLLICCGNRPTRLWSTDGTAEGTYELPGLNPVENEIATLGDRALFLATDEMQFQRLVSTDGTPGGTETVADLWRFPAGPEHLTSFGGKVFFGAFSLAGGVEPWVTDGTLAGTHPFADLRPGGNYLGSSFPQGFVAAQGRLWFFAGSEGNFGNRSEVWRTDGTPEGTERVFSFDPEDFGVNRLVPVGDRLFLFVDGFYEQRLFAYGGPAEGMTELGRWTPTLSLPVFTEEETVVGNRLFFASPSISGELWISDGTRVGTRTIPRSDGRKRELEYGIHGFAGYAFFVAGTRPSERALWVSDGTAAGTFPIVRNAGGWIRAIGPHLFFTRWTPGLGVELWAIDRTGPE